MNSSVRAITYYLPEKVITNEDIIERLPVFTRVTLEENSRRPANS